jgi:hypothetical protein
MKIGVLELQNLVEPMNDFDIRIATQFAKGCSALDGFKADWIQFAKQLGTTNFRHS